jgi:hypothetical protein
MRRGSTKALAARLALAALLLACGARGAVAFEGKFAPAGEGFSVSFPGQPRKASRRQEAGPLSVTMSTYGLDHGGVGYFVAWVGDLPAEAMREPMLEDIFYSRLEQNLLLSARMAGRSDLSVAARSDITLGGFTGRQYVFNSASDLCVLRAYKAGLRFYAVGVYGPKDHFAAGQAVEFLESFALTQKK